MEFGLNLFSLRNFIQNESDFANTAEKLKKAGYSYLQFSGAPLNSEMIKRVSDKTGMPIRLTHAPMDRILNDPERLMEEHSYFGCDKIGLGMMPIPESKDDSEIKALVDKLNEVGGLFRKNGFTLCYHNHHFEFVKNSDGETWIDYILKNAENIHFTLDTYWVRYGGASVTEVLNKLNGRVDCIHIKDYKIERDGEEFKPRFAAIGDGNMNFDPIIDTAKKCGAEYFFVEQDDACSYENPFNEVEKSIKFLNKRYI